MAVHADGALLFYYFVKLRLAQRDYHALDFFTRAVALILGKILINGIRSAEV